MATPNSSRRKSGRYENHHHAYGFAQFFADIIKFELDTGLVDCLVSRCVLTIEDADRIRGTSGQTRRNKLLLSILKDRPYNTFSSFTEALQTSDPIHNDLVNKMKAFEIKDGQPDDIFEDDYIEIDDVCVRFHKSFQTLVDEICSPMNIADILLELEAFNREDYEDVSSISTKFQQNRKLLSKVAGKGRSGYENFLEALKKSIDPRDQELASEVEKTVISKNDKLLLHIGFTLSQENENVPSNIRELAKEIEDCWIEQDAAFVETNSTIKVLNTVKNSNFVTIVGSSGSGKTAVMRHVVLKLKYMEGFQVIHIDSPGEILKHRDGNAKQIFLIDDVLGTYAINSILVEKWERLDTKIQHYLNINPGNMKILFTLRKQVVNNQTFSNCSSIITQNIVDLEDDQIALSKEEKKQILTKHLKINDMESGITENDLEEACASDYAFPLLCRIVSSNEERLSNIAKFFREPFSVLEVELRKLWTKNKEVYCSLVFCMLLNGKIGKDFFDVNLPKHEMYSIVAEACGLFPNVSRTVIEDGLKTVVGTYVSSENGSFSFMHDAFQESISSNFAKLNPAVMFSRCEINLIRDRVRINCKLPDDDENVIVIDQDKFESIAKRIITELEAGRFSNVLFSHLIKSEDFVEYLVTKLKNEKDPTINTLIKKVSLERRINKKTIYYFVKSIKNFWVSLCCPCCTSKKTEKTNNNKIDVDNAALKQVIRAPSRQSTFLHWLLASGCYIVFRFFWKNTTKKERKQLLSRDSKFKLTKPFFPLAVLGGNIDIIRTLHSCGADVNCFSYEGETPLSITAKFGRDDIATVLIDWGADVNQPDMCSHRLPSFICVENESVEVLKVLLNNNCDVNLVDIYGRTSTMLQALLTRKRNIVNVLLEFDATNQPLHAAILNCDVDYLKTHLRNKDINSQTRNGLTPLHYATQVNSTNMIKILLGDEETTEQLMAAGSSEEQPLVHSVVANINSKNKNGLTPLHLAVLNDHVEAVKLLVQNNANVIAKDKFGRIPLHYSQISAISSLLLNRDISRSTVLYSPLSRSVVPGNQSDEVIVDIDGDQDDHRRALSWCTVFQNVAWFILPFKRCIYRGNVNQPDNQGNTPLHAIVETAYNRHSRIEKTDHREDNFKLLIKHGANIHLHNDQDDVPFDLVGKQNDLQDLFTPHASRIKNHHEKVECVLLLLSFILCLALVTSPFSWAMSGILNEYNFLNYSDLNTTTLDVLEQIEDRADDLLIHYFFLIAITLDILTSVMIIRVVIQLWKTNSRYRIACFILFFMMQCVAVTNVIVYNETINIIRLISVLLTLIANNYLGVATCIQILLSFKIKRLQKILFIHVLLRVLYSVTTILLALVKEPINIETTSTINKTVSDIIQNGSAINQVTDFIDKTTFRPSTCTSMNCTENFSVPKQDFTSFNHSLVYIMFIYIGLYIFHAVYEKSLIRSNKNKRLVQMTVVNLNMMGFIWVMFCGTGICFTLIVKTWAILNEISRRKS